MLPHPPKTAALVAYAAGRLSAAATRRLEGHLARCEVCRQQLAGIRAYDHLAREVRSTPYPEPDWGKMRSALERDAAEWKARRRKQTLFVGLALGLLLGGAMLFRGAWQATLDSSTVQAELERASSGFQACFDDARAHHAGLPSAWRMRLTIAGDGRVEGGDVYTDASSEPPASFARCLLAVAAGRSFDATGRRASFEIPLSFSNDEP